MVNYQFTYKRTKAFFYFLTVALQRHEPGNTVIRRRCYTEQRPLAGLEHIRLPGGLLEDIQNCVIMICQPITGYQQDHGLSHRSCSCRWAPPQPGLPALPSWPPSTCPSSSLLLSRPPPGPLPFGQRQVPTRRRSPRLRLHPGRRTRCCRRVCCCPLRRGGCGCRSGSSPRSLSCCSTTYCSRKCCSRRCCSRRCRKTHTRSRLEVWGRCRRLSSRLRYSNPPPRSPGRKERFSWLHVRLPRRPGAGWAQRDVQLRGCGVESDGSRGLDTLGPAGTQRQ